MCAHSHLCSHICALICLLSTHMFIFVLSYVFVCVWTCVCASVLFYVCSRAFAYISVCVLALKSALFILLLRYSAVFKGSQTTGSQTAPSWYRPSFGTPFAQRLGLLGLPSGDCGAGAAAGAAGVTGRAGRGVRRRHQQQRQRHPRTVTRAWSISACNISSPLRSLSDFPTSCTAKEEPPTRPPMSSPLPPITWIMDRYSPTSAKSSGSAGMRKRLPGGRSASKASTTGSRGADRAATQDASHLPRACHAATRAGSASCSRWLAAAARSVPRKCIECA